MPHKTLVPHLTGRFQARLPKQFCASHRTSINNDLLMMAPASRSSSATLRSNSHANGDSGPFEAPPSTMAAQLINGISTTKQPAQPAEQSYLQSIMSEVSSMENSAIKPDDPAVLLVHKHKLIYVLARALLEKLGGEDPFLDVQQAVSQASEALDVFAATIKEFPEVLEYVLPAGTTLQARGSAPLWVWLFPRVLTLLGQANCESLSGRIERLFSVSFQAVSQSPKLWNMSSMFFIYFKECVTSMSDSLAVSNHDLTFIAALLEYIRDHNLRSEVQSTSAVLPSVNMEWASLFMNEDETCSEFVAGCTYTLRNVSRCISHGKILLSILLGISAEAVLLHRATPAFSDYIGWMLDSFISLDELERRRLSISTIQNQTATVGWAFCAVKTLLSSLQEFISPAILQRLHFTCRTLC